MPRIGDQLARHGRCWQEFEHFAPDDDIAEMEQEEALSKIKLSKSKNPKDVLDEIAAIESNYGVTLEEKKKSALMLRLGKDH